MQSFKCPLHLFVDDFMGLSRSKSGASHCQTQIVRFMQHLFHPDIIAEEKNVLAQKADILGWLINLLAPGEPTMRPKDGAIDKLCFILWSFDVQVAQPLPFWQALQSLTERYSAGLRGMRCHVAPFSVMVAKCTPRSFINTPVVIVGSSALLPLSKERTKDKNHNTNRFISCKATAITRFAIEMWRICSLLLWKNPDSFAVPISHYLRLKAVIKEGLLFEPQYVAISDAGPIRVAVAIYLPNHEFGTPIAWSSVAMPWLKDTKNQYQGVREYVGLILSFALIAKKFPRSLLRDPGSGIVPPVTFKWISDSKTALSWAATDIARSAQAQMANMVVCWFALYSTIELIDQIHIPGVNMGEIDAESRREIHLERGNLSYAPSLTSEFYIDLSSSAPFMELLEAICPTHHVQKVDEFFATFLRVHHALKLLFPVTVAC
jgi:hypothetical protein